MGCEGLLCTQSQVAAGVTSKLVWSQMTSKRFGEVPLWRHMPTSRSHRQESWRHGCSIGVLLCTICSLIGRHSSSHPSASCLCIRQGQRLLSLLCLRTPGWSALPFATVK